MKVALLILTVLVAVMLAPSATASPQQNRLVICKVFKKYCTQALEVSRCESGHNTWARNGQYLGLFQMGSYARGRYGHHPSSPWIQARAAYRYFVASGRDWSPWSCKPW